MSIGFFRYRDYPVSLDRHVEPPACEAGDGRRDDDDRKAEVDETVSGGIAWSGFRESSRGGRPGGRGGRLEGDEEDWAFEEREGSKSDCEFERKGRFVRTDEDGVSNCS
jgi:hypothetical protein